MTFRLNSNLSLSGKKEGSFMYKINELYDLDHNLINQIEANWKEPLNIALHKYHYQKERG